MLDGADGVKSGAEMGLQFCFVLCELEVKIGDSGMLVSGTVTAAGY